MPAGTHAIRTMSLMDNMAAALLHRRLTPWPRDIALSTRLWAILQAFLILWCLDLCGVAGFRVLHYVVRRIKVASRPAAYDALSLVRIAMRDACIFYFKPVVCLQRSAAVTW